MMVMYAMRCASTIPPAAAPKQESVIPASDINPLQLCFILNKVGLNNAILHAIHSVEAATLFQVLLQIRILCFLLLESNSDKGGACCASEISKSSQCRHLC